MVILAQIAKWHLGVSNWFILYDFSGRTLESINLSSISLSGKKEDALRAIDFVHPFGLLATSRLAPQPVFDSAAAFFGTWFVGLNVNGAVTNVDIAAVQAQFGEGEMKNSEQVAVWWKKFLIMWLAADHGSVEEAGHCRPGAEGYARLPERLLREGPFAIARLELPQLK